jgi:hypothetical protein
MAITSIASLETVKTYLRIPNPSTPNADDATIQILMDAAQEAVEREVGHVVETRVRTERHNGGKCEIWLRELPCLYVVRVQEGWGYYDWELDDQEVNTITALSIWSYSLDNPTQGLITRRSAGNVLVPFVRGRNNVVVDYVAGRNTLPPNAVLAFCELVSIWYRQSQMRMGGGAARALEGLPYNAQNADFTRATGDSSLNLGVPDAIIEMLKGAGRRRPIIG